MMLDWIRKLLQEDWMFNKVEQGPLKKWIEHSKQLHKYVVGGGDPDYNPGVDGVLYSSYLS